MKKSMIKKIFCGERGSFDSMAMTEEERQLLTNVIDAEEKLLKGLTISQKLLHDKYVEARESEFCEELENIYLEAFKIGLLVGIECAE